MSILIKGMEMPKHCNDCELSARVNLEYGYGYCCQILTEMISNTHERKTNCPLTEIPDGHGRLIDADELLNAIKKAWEDDSEIADVYKEDYAAVSDWLYTAPTVIPSDKDGET